MSTEKQSLEGYGRGALLEKIKRRQAEKLLQQQQQQTASEAAEVSAVPVASTSTAGTGRAALIAKLQKQEKQEQRPGSFSSSDCTSPPNIGGGRASLIRKLIEQKASTSSEELDEKCATPESSEVIGQIKNLSIDDKSLKSEPIIKRGSYGKEIELASNYINLTFDKGCGIFQYVVKFVPNIDSIQVRKFLIDQHLNTIGETRNFDGATLCVPRKLYSDNITLTSKDKENKMIQVNLIFKKQIPELEIISFLNKLMKHVLIALNLVPIGRQNFCPKTGHKLPKHHLELWPGYFTAVNEVEGGLKLCVDAAHKVIRTDTVYDKFKQLSSRTPEHFQQKIMSELVGTSVITLYNNKIYRIDDIAFDMTPQMQFDKNGEKMTLIDYYRTHWNIEIKDPNQPLLIHCALKRTTTGEKVESTIHLVPELCNLTGLTEDIRNDFKMMRDLAEITQVSPSHRRENILKFIDQINENKAASLILSKWGIKLDADIVNFSGRVLPPENILFGNKTVPVNAKANWSTNAVKCAVLETPNLNSWVLIHVEDDRRLASEFVKMLMNVTSAMQIQVNQPRIHKLRDDRTETIVHALRQSINNDVELVVIILPTNRSDRYSAIKKICCVEKPIASQIIIRTTLSRPDKLKSIVEKIALQINCKLGGALWSLKIPLKKTMIIGVDVYHCDSQHQRNSVVGFVASIDFGLKKWYSTTCMQSQHQEMVDVLKISLASACSVFYEHNQCYPERIIMYRDGVGNGQLMHVQKYEVPQLLQLINTFQPNYKPSLAVIIIQKRICTRLMTEMSGKLVNAPSGTVADSEVTNPNYYDFFLVPQIANRGTVTPTHYIVLYDTTGLTVDQLQRLSYKLCHLYYNWPGTIRVPAPCQYAHKIAYLIGQNVQKRAHDSLTRKLYYL